MTASKTVLKSLPFACCAVALMAAAAPQPAHAQFGGIGGMIMRNMGAIPFDGGRWGGSRSRGSARSNGGDNNANSGNSNTPTTRSDDARVTPGAPSSKVQNNVLYQMVQLNADLGGAAAGSELGVTKDIRPLGKAASKEGERDWTKEVQDIVNRFQSESKKLTTPGDVTGHSIEQSLDAAIKNAKLELFETFLGENWTAERLRVMVLERVKGDLDGLFNGNSHGFASMQEVDRLIQQAAQATYRRIFELTELLAANRSSALFMQHLYQTHGDLVDDQLREITDDTITRASAQAIAKFEDGLRSDPNTYYALHYRAQRIVFDCLTDGVARVSSSETGIAPLEEIKHNIETTATGECVKWLDHQFGSDTRSIVQQRPLPLRVVWSADGPQDDKSMYGRATKGF